MNTIIAIMGTNHLECNIITSLTSLSRTIVLHVLLCPLFQQLHHYDIIGQITSL